SASVAMTTQAVARGGALPILVQDGVLAFVLMALSILSQVDHRPNDPKTDVWSYLLAVVGMGALTWRRTNPVTVLVVTTVAAVLMSSLGYADAGLPWAAMIAFYSVSPYAHRQSRLVAFL